MTCLTPVKDDHLCWGFLGVSGIAELAARAAAASRRARLAAVASRDAAGARVFAARQGFGRAYGSYDELLKDSEVEAVYVSVPNALHLEWAGRGLAAGKHVLCEKPLWDGAADVERLFDLADERGLLLSEGFMYRHHPATRLAAQLVGEGAIGELRAISSSWQLRVDPETVGLSRELRGGALMVAGCYGVNLSRLFAGEPKRVQAMQVLGPTGVDLSFAGTLLHAGGVLAQVECGLDHPYGQRFTVAGTEGTLESNDPWYGRRPLVLRRCEHVEELDAGPGDGYVLQFEEFGRAVRDGTPLLLGRADGVPQARALEALVRAAAGGEMVALEPVE